MVDEKDAPKAPVETPEAESWDELKKPRAGTLRGPTLGAKGDVDATRPDRAEGVIDFDKPPVRPKEVQ